MSVFVDSAKDRLSYGYKMFGRATVQGLVNEIEQLCDHLATCNAEIAQLKEWLGDSRLISQQHLADLEQLRALITAHEEETDQFNAGHDAAIAGQSIDDQPHYEPDHDMWSIGWVWGAYHSKRLITPNRWIPISERQPVEGQQVLVYDGNIVFVATWQDGWWWETPDFTADDVSHWRPLPEPPAEEK